MHALLPLLLCAAASPRAAIVGLGPRLDPAQARPDLACLEQLAACARGLRAADLRRLSGALAAGHPGRASAVLASAWGREADEAHVRWLVAVACAGDPRAGRAAVHALTLAGRAGALHRVLEWSVGREDALTRGALAAGGLPRANSGDLERWRARAGDLPRLGPALEELARRSAPVTVAEELATVGPWARRAVWRRLVARGDDGARAAVRAGLRDERPAVLAALETWTPPPGELPHPGVLRLLRELEHDPPAHARLASSLGDRRRRALLGAR